jgi:hypothetical protein
VLAVADGVAAVAAEEDESSGVLDVWAVVVTVVCVVSVDVLVPL